MCYIRLTLDVVVFAVEMSSDTYSITHTVFICFFQAEDGIRDLVRSRGLGDVYKRQDIPIRSGCRSH